MKEQNKDKLFNIVFTVFVILMVVGWLYRLEVEKDIPWIDKWEAQMK